MKKTMPKLIILGIIVLLVICAAYFINKKKGDSASKNNGPTISAEEQENIRKYISLIYLPSTIVDKEDMFPEFKNIEDASNDWILNCMYASVATDFEELYSGKKQEKEVVEDDVDVENLTEEEIDAMLEAEEEQEQLFDEDMTDVVTKETFDKIKLNLFRSELKKELPNKDKYENVVVENGTVDLVGMYEPTSEYLYSYVMGDINKNKAGEYEVTIYEYRMNELIDEDSKVKVFSRDGENVLFETELSDVSEEGALEMEASIEKYIKSHKESFETVKATIKKENNRYYIKSIER